MKSFGAICNLLMKQVVIYFSSHILQLIKEIMNAVTIPVMAKARVGHFAEAQILQALGVDMIDESEGMYTGQIH